jgi:uncharacterized FlaG/YvyC family protein
MKIDPSITLYTPGTGSQNTLQANSGLDSSGKANNSSAASNQANGQAKVNPPSNEKQKTGNTNASSVLTTSGLVGGFALDDDKNVVVRFYDSKGNVVAQYPPESYLKQMKELNQVAKNLFHKTA